MKEEYDFSKGKRGVTIQPNSSSASHRSPLWAIASVKLAQQSPRGLGSYRGEATGRWNG